MSVGSAQVDARQRLYRDRAPQNDHAFAKPRNEIRSGASTKNRMVDHQDNYRPDHRDQHAVQVKTRNTGRTELCKHETTDNCAYDSENDIEDETFALFVNDFTPEETRDKAENDPTQN
jgi:hypothetical protein